MKNSMNQKRLSLNKQTVTELNKAEMQNVDGGTALLCEIVKTVFETRIPIFV